MPVGHHAAALNASSVRPRRPHFVRRGETADGVYQDARVAAVMTIATVVLLMASSPGRYRTAAALLLLAVGFGLVRLLLALRWLRSAEHDGAPVRLDRA